MVKGQKKVLEARSKEGRQRVRKQLGTLKSLTVQPVTQQRYKQALQLFFDFLRREKLTLPKQRGKLDPIVSDFLEHLWSTGEGRAVASNVLAALQDFDPKLKGQLPGSWRLMKAWSTNEIPCRAPPLTEQILKSMVGWSFLHEEFSFGVSLLVGFYGLLRAGELLALQSWQVHMIGPSSPAVLSLGLTKSGKRAGAEESVTLTDVAVLPYLWAWKQKATTHQFLTAKPHKWRELFQKCLTDMKLSEWGFRPYSLRRGGATTFFMKCGSLDRVLLMGRWTAAKTARIYLNSGLALLAEIKISTNLLRPFLTVFTNTTPSKLEPALQKKNRAGGRGKEKKPVLKRGKQNKGGGKFPFAFFTCAWGVGLNLGVARFS